MIFNKINDAKKALETIRKESPNSKKVHYPILFKKALMDFIYSQKEFTREGTARYLGLGSGLIHNWDKQYQEGLYSLDGAYCVSKKSKSLNGKILAELKQQISALQSKIEIIQQAEKLGLKIVEN